MRSVRPRVILLMVGLVVIGASFRGRWLNPLLDAGRVAAEPAERAVGRTGDSIRGVVSSIARVATLSERVRTFENELARAVAENAGLRSIAEENKRLRETLALLPRLPSKVTLAEVIGPSTDGASTAVRINRGTRDGIAARAPVIAADGVAVGLVRDVLPNSATVDLLSSGRVRIAARDLATGAEGIVRGLRGLDVVIEDVPRTAELRAGDRLVTTGLDGAFPPHLFVGTVRSVRAPEYAIFQEGSVQLPLDPASLRLVAVIVGS